MNPFAQTVRARRQELGKTQRQVADLIGIRSADFLCLVEKGRRFIDLDRLPKLAQALELELTDLARVALEARAPHLAAALFAAPAVPPEGQA